MLSFRTHIESPKRQVLTVILFTCFSIAYSCTKSDFLFLDYEFNDIDTITVIPHENHAQIDRVRSHQYAPLGFAHQSAAVYGDYSFFITAGRSKVCLYNLVKKEILFTLELKAENKSIYHCNQCSFGVDKYLPSDPFPLLYVSQNAKSDKRCFIEVYRILTEFDEVLSDYFVFSIELIQTIFLPAMSYDNSMGNVNCVIDQSNDLIYTYSRNNNTDEDNYGLCKITCFSIPPIDGDTVVLEDYDILSSFMIDCKAHNMQGGCIENGILYIGQGYSSVGYIYLNIIDIKKQELTRRIDLIESGITWEPEGCFYYDGSIMLTHTSAISRIVY